MGGTIPGTHGEKFGEKVGPQEGPCPQALVQNALAKAKKGKRQSEAGIKAAAGDSKAAQGVSPPMTKAEIAEAFRRLAAANPEPTTDAEPTPTRSRCWSPWCCRRRPPTPASTRRRRRCSRWPIRRPRWRRSAKTAFIRDLIKPSDCFRTKAKNVALLAHKLVTEHGGEVPRTREALGGAARRRPQDRECRAQYGIRRTHDRRRYAYLPPSVTAPAWRRARRLTMSR